MKMGVTDLVPTVALAEYVTLTESHGVDPFVFAINPLSDTLVRIETLLFVVSLFGKTPMF